MNHRSLLSALAGLLLSLSLAASESRLDPRVFAGKTAGETASFLVVLREQADLSGADFLATKDEKTRFVFEALTAQAEATQGPLRARLDAAGVPYRSLYLVNMIEVDADRPLAEELAALEDVSSITPNKEAPLSRVPDVPETLAPQRGVRPGSLATVEDNIARVGAPVVWAQGFTGQGIVVGMADTGVVWDHPALKSHYRGFDGSTVSHDYNWHDAIHNARTGNPCGSDAPAPCDDLGHGTSTTSLAVGDDGVGNQVGMAPGARFIACRNMDLNDGTPARYTECFQFLMAPTDRNGANPRPDLGAHVINNSWGCPQSEGCTDPNVLKAVVEHVRAAGILVVVSAGNSGSSCATILDVPAFYDASFTIGATTNTDVIASFSSRGPITADGSNRLKPDICAPGESTEFPRVLGLRVAVPPNGYSGGFRGTSASAPHVTGAIALLWSAAPELKGQVTTTTELLKRTAVPLTSTQDCGGFPGSTVPNPIFGSGRLNIAAAVNIAVPPARPKAALSPRRGIPRRLAPRA